MIKQLSSGTWLISGEGVKDFGNIGEAAVVISNKEMQEFITEKVHEHTEHALKILIEHQRRTLLPEQRTENGE